MEKDKLNMNRREFLKRLGIGTGSAMALMAMEPLSAFAQKDKKVVDNRMTYRVQHGSGEQISLLGFGMMRLPNNQEEVNQLVDYAIEHGVNYYDTAPMYMRGQSEVLMGNASLAIRETNISSPQRCRIRNRTPGVSMPRSVCTSSRWSD